MIRIDESAIEIDAAVVANGLGMDPRSLRQEMRAGRVTSRCERGVGKDEGRWRLSIFSATRRLRIVIDAEGRIVQRSAIDFGGRPLPAELCSEPAN